MIAVLHNMRSVHNVGSLFRTSDAAGVSKLYLTGITPAPIDSFGRARSAFTKVSLGAEQTVQWESVAPIAEVIIKLKQQGFVICALEQSSQAISCWTYPISEDSLQRLALIVGSEVDGVPPDVLKQCDVIVDIPMYGEKESLNVSVAFGICVYSFLERTKK